MGRQCSKEMSGFIRALSILLIFASGGLMFGCSGSTSNDSSSGGSLDRLVVYGSVDDKMLEVIKTNFKTTATATDTPEFQSGRDVLLIDARQQDPKMITNESHVFRTAYDAGIPIMVLHMDDEFEGAVHKLLPTLLISGYSGLALIIPPRAGMDASDGVILQATKDDVQDQSWEVSQSVVETMIAEMKKIYQTRESKTSSASRTLQSQSDDDKCTADGDPVYCTFVRKVGLATITIIKDFPSDHACLSLDWQYKGVGMSYDPTRLGPHLVLQLAPSATFLYATPQCPRQVFNFYPVLYLNDPINGTPSRVVMIKMNALLSPGGLAKRDGDGIFWYQSLFGMQLTPYVTSSSGWTQNGIIWRANLPHSANSAHEVTDSTEWGLDVSGKASKDDWAEIGGHVNFTHEVTNHLDDWKFVDFTSQTVNSAYWSFKAIQSFPYDAERDDSYLCDAMGEVVDWLGGIKCLTTAKGIHYDLVPDLSWTSSNISGLAVWDLGSNNNNSATAKFTFGAITQFDAAGCSRWSKYTYWGNSSDMLGRIAHPDNISDFACFMIDQAQAENQYGDYIRGFWLNRAWREMKVDFTIPLNYLPIPTK